MKAPSYTSLTKPVKVFCNGVPESKSRKRKCTKISLEYRPYQKTKKNIQIGLEEFILSVFHLPDRVQDLLEIAAYVFCADRLFSRGSRNNVEYHSWSRDFEYFIGVRDYDFWNSDQIRDLLSKSLEWMTGDKEHTFNFYPGHKTGKAGLFDNEKYAINEKGVPRIVLFSGGLDSLAGTVELLNTCSDSLWLISHRSANPSTARTQLKLIEALQSRYTSRINHRVLKCHFHKVRAPEESQRTRAFLYCSMAFAMASALKRKEFYLYENGVTALNFSKRGGMLNARASRTAHPKTIRLLQKLLSIVSETTIEIKQPFAFKTKTEVVQVLKNHKQLDLINSSVSCSRTFNKLGQATHCGQCSQCIDRRFAAYAAGCDSADEGGIYAFDFIHEKINNGELRIGIIDFLRQARYFLHSNIDNFYVEMLDQLTSAIDLNHDELAQVELIHSLCQRQGNQVQEALQRMLKPFEEYPDGSLSTLLEKKDFSRPPVHAVALDLATVVEDYIRKAFVFEKPSNENDLNAKINGFLSGHRERFDKEYPSLQFATARTVPDHSKSDLLIEAKYIRGATTPSKATEGIAADLTKYPDDTLKLFIVYDPEGKIYDRNTFKRDFEDKRYCIIHII